MKKFTMKHVEQIEKMLADGKQVKVEWHTPYEKGCKTEIVKQVRWDGLVFTTGDCIYTGIDRLVAIKEA